MCSGAAFSFERLVEAMKASILDRLLIVFTGHVDSSNLGNDFATREGLEAHRLGTAGLTFGGDVTASVVMGSDAVSLGDGVRRFDRNFWSYLQGSKRERTIFGHFDISALDSCIETSGISCPMSRHHKQQN